MNQKLLVEVFKSSDLKAALDTSKVPDGMMLVEGVFGRVDSENRNKRRYPKAEYAKHVKLLQERIAESNGIFGEMEHPKSMNIDYNNVSHKITSIRLDEDGFVRGEVLLLDTPKGKIAQSIVKSGSPLGISSRAVGNVSENGEVRLNFLSTYDLVGTSGFAEARLNQSIMECYDDDNNVVSEIFEHVLDDAGNVVNSATLQGIVESVESRLSKNFIAKDDVQAMINEAVQNANVGATKVVNEGGEDVMTEQQIQAMINEQFTNVFAPLVESWVTKEFAPEFGTVLEKWLSNDWSNLIESWVTQEYGPKLGTHIQEWLTQEFAPVIESWVTTEALHENAIATQSWITKEFAPKLGTHIQEWLSNDYAPVLESWISTNYISSDDARLLNETAQVNESFNVGDAVTIWDAEKGAPCMVTIQSVSDERITYKPEDSDLETDGKEIGVEYAEFVDLVAKAQTPVKENVQPTVQTVSEQASIFASKLLQNINEDVDAAKNAKDEDDDKNKKPEKVDESLYKFAPVWLQRIPENCKPIWESLTPQQRDKIYKRASIRLMETVDDISRFWKGIDFDAIVESGSQQSATTRKRVIVNEDVDPAKIRRQGLVNLAMSMRNN